MVGLYKENMNALMLLAVMWFRAKLCVHFGTILVTMVTMVKLRKNLRFAENSLPNTNLAIR